MSYRITHLDALEAESIHILREAVAESERPALLFSGGKDSAVLLRLAIKAFSPARLPFPLLHIDTGHNFPEVLDFRDKTVEGLGLKLVVASVQDAIDEGRLAEPTGTDLSRNRLQIEPLLRAIDDNKFTALFGGARRDEEKARAKERMFSFRDEFGQWDPKAQRPELWNLYNGLHHVGEHVRVFPISNWTEVDIWQYILEQEIDLPSIYFSHKRTVFERDGLLFTDSEFIKRADHEELFEGAVRYRTVGDISCTGAFLSTARTIPEVISEVLTTRITERGASRADDRQSETAMEDRKREGYF